MRSVDVLIWALIWINVVGLGPFAGALAIACSDFGALGKLFSEAIETCDRRPGEGVVASGGSALHRIRFGLIPGVLPVLASQVLYFFESNTRSATIIGIVGAGGIGQYLTELIRVLELTAGRLPGADDPGDGGGDRLGLHPPAPGDHRAGGALRPCAAGLRLRMS